MVPHSQDPSRPIGTYWNPYQARLLDQNIPSLWKAWITGSLIFTEVSSFGSEAAAFIPLQALGVDAEEVPHGTHVALLGRLMDVLALEHEPNPLGSCKLLEGARLVNRDTQIAIPSRMGKPEIKKPS